MRRLFGPRGGVTRQDVLAAAGAGAGPNEDVGFAARVARRWAKKKGGSKKAEEAEQIEARGKAKQGGQILRGIN